MVTKRPKIVIIGAGMAGLTAATKLYSASHLSELPFDLSVVDGAARIGGRISSSEFYGDRIEQGATWIHGIHGSPVYKIAGDTNSLNSDQPWECMDGIPPRPVTAAEGGHRLNPLLVDPISRFFKTLMDFAQGKKFSGGPDPDVEAARRAASDNPLSLGTFLRRGLEDYRIGRNNITRVGCWAEKSLQEGIFAMLESTQRTFTSAPDLENLDYFAEKEYVMFPGEEITIARGYSAVIEALASTLPAGTIQLGLRVKKIEWRRINDLIGAEEFFGLRPVKLHFEDGSIMKADHVIVTVSLGVLKHGIRDDVSLFDPPLPERKTQAISRLGYGVVDKVFLRIRDKNFPFLQMVFHPSNSRYRDPKIPQWIRRTSFVSPIYRNSRTLVSWFTGKEALEVESLPENDIIAGFTATVSNLLPQSSTCRCSNGGDGGGQDQFNFEIDRVLRTQWGTNPLFLGSYSYIAVGSTTQDMDTLAEPLPSPAGGISDSDETPAPAPAPWKLQILFAGEATHSKHYSTTHGAYFSGLREANRLLQHYHYDIIGP
ncbi:probable polyamine oxidase 5 [Andrographis paniculata]|uniref:probable polyamine oxidase 5 n=1 Tax=Andrographis paniculata TaxID=175694 RepID=UPI0021E7F1A8|nr:probable polyamine oxidase 5 [Andrographis paniculata]